LGADIKTVLFPEDYNIVYVHAIDYNVVSGGLYLVLGGTLSINLSRNSTFWTKMRVSAHHVFNGKRVILNNIDSTNDFDFLKYVVV
jgi:hypothetical protein